MLQDGGGDIADLIVYGSQAFLSLVALILSSISDITAKTKLLYKVSAAYFHTMLIHMYMCIMSFVKHNRVVVSMSHRHETIT